MAGGYGIAPFRLFCDELRAAGPRGPGLLRRAHRGRPPDPRRLRRRSACRWSPPPTTAAPATAGASPSRWRRTSTRAPAPSSSTPAGPDAMLHAVARLAARRGVPAQVSLDPWMGCGVGTCLGLRGVDPAPRTTPRPHYRCACTEGPVFDAREVVWAGEDVLGRAPRRRRGDPAMSLAVAIGGPAPQEPAHRRLRHLRLRRGVRGHPRPLDASAASSPRASTSSRATAAPRRASWRRRRAC